MLELVVLHIKSLHISSGRREGSLTTGETESHDFYLQRVERGMPSRRKTEKIKTDTVGVRMIVGLDFEGSVENEKGKEVEGEGSFEFWNSKEGTFYTERKQIGHPRMTDVRSSL